MKRIRRTVSVPGQEKASDRWRSPRRLVEALDAEFGFEIDLAADAENALTFTRGSGWFGPGSDLALDALATRWRDHGERGYGNFPYSSPLVALFMEHAARQAHEFTTVALTPYTPSETWWQWTRYATEIREIPHRVPYLRADGATAASAMFSSAVLVFRPQPGVKRAQPRRVTWTWLTDDELEKRRQRAATKIENAWKARGGRP